MAIFAIGDLHFSGIPPTKPMHIFGANWENHREKILNSWQESVQPNDTVILCGDISWAMNLQTAMENDLRSIIALPGKKVILKGNHDYWWTSLKKMEKVTENNLSFLQNNFFTDNSTAICGTRGWNLPFGDDFLAEDQLILTRECGRLETSLKLAQAQGYKDFIVGMHYPPLYKNIVESVFTEIMEKYNVKQCIFGHVHGEDATSVFQGEKNGITYKLVAADYTKFQLIKLT